MEMNYDEFMLRFLRPAVFNGEELEIVVNFKDASMYSVNIDTVKALCMSKGDTICISGCVLFDEGDKETHSKSCTFYIDGEQLTDFINKYGVRNITGNVKVRVKHTYAVLTKEKMDSIEYEEIIGFKLLNLI